MSIRTPPTPEQEQDLFARLLRDRPVPSRDPRQHLSPYVVTLIRKAVADGHKQSDIAAAYQISKSTVTRIAKRISDEAETAIQILSSSEMVDAEAELRQKLSPSEADSLIFLTRIGVLVREGYSLAQAKRAIESIEHLREPRT